MIRLRSRVTKLSIPLTSMCLALGLCNVLPTVAHRLLYSPPRKGMTVNVLSLLFLRVPRRLQRHLITLRLPKTVGLMAMAMFTILMASGRPPGAPRLRGRPVVTRALP